MQCAKKGKIFLFGYILFVLTVRTFAWAEIPYVQGVDYLPQHYSGYYSGENKNFAISDDDIEKDMHTMSQNFDAIRTYEYDPINLQRILRTAKRYDMKVAVGLKINADNPEYTDFQLNGLNEMFLQYPDLLDPVITIVMGNDVIGHNKKTSRDIDYLVKQFDKISTFSWIKDKKIPLSISENADTLLTKEIATNLLRRLPRKITIFVNINPYMAGCSLNGAIRRENSCKNGNSFPDIWERLINGESAPWLKNYQLVIGASGWPTEGAGLNVPSQTSNGTILDAIEYYQFLYPYLSRQIINHRSIAVPFFVFSAFDQPMNGVFGFASNFWGVYNFDSSAKLNMVYPMERTVKPEPKVGTNIKIILVNSHYANERQPVSFQTKNDTYYNKSPGNKKKKEQYLSFIESYPFVEYSVKGSNKVVITLPNTGNSRYPAAKCTNELISGNGYGIQSEMSLQWASPFSKDPQQDACKYINWAENGIFIVG